jgi:acyl-CoA reductase-like NAD-dependent aldehyde dehydrogenase
MIDPDVARRVFCGERVMLKPTYPYYLANEAVAANTDLEVTDKYSGEVATRVALADAKAIDQAIAAAHSPRSSARP